MEKRIITILFIATIFFGCNTDKPESGTVQNAEQAEGVQGTLPKYIKPFRPELPTIGLLMYDGVLQSEVVATSDVFAKPSEEGEQLFNVVTISETESPITTEEGLRLIPDYSFKNCPSLTALFVPSAYDMYGQVRNKKLLGFIREKNKETEYTISNCAGAQLIGASGIANGHKIVTYIGGGEQLQKDFPNLKVQDDSRVTFVEDGKFSSSNGNLASYISALHVLEKMSSPEHRDYVESYLYLERLQNWRK